MRILAAECSFGSVLLVTLDDADDRVSVSPRRKRASPLPKDDHSGGVKDSLLANSSDPVEMRRLNYQTPGEECEHVEPPNTHGSPGTTLWNTVITRVFAYFLKAETCHSAPPPGVKRELEEAGNIQQLSLR